MNGLPFMMYQFVPEAIKHIPTFAGLSADGELLIR